MIASQVPLSAQPLVSWALLGACLTFLTTLTGPFPLPPPRRHHFILKEVRRTTKLRDLYSDQPSLCLTPALSCSHLPPLILSRIYAIHQHFLFFFSCITKSSKLQGFGYPSPETHPLASHKMEL